MHPRYISKNHVAKLLTAILFVMFLVGCDAQHVSNPGSSPRASNTSSPTVGITETAGVTPIIGASPTIEPSPTIGTTPTTESSPTSNPYADLSMNKPGVSINRAGLHIQAGNGLQCPSGYQQGKPDNPGPPVDTSSSPSDLLVLVKNPSSYTSAEIQSLKTYIQRSQDLSPVSYSQQMPSTLHWILGGPT